MTTAMQPAEAVERVLIQGDLDRLTPDQRVSYYRRVCESLELNPLTKPFEYLKLNGKLILYARKDCTEQLRKRDRVSTAIVGREVVEGVYVVTARATTADGRGDESIGAVPIDGLKGEARANAMMKAETKAKRRVTLSICGLGMLDETEVESIPGAQPVAEPARQLAAHQPPTAREPGEDDPDEVSPVEAYISGLEAAASRGAVRAIADEAAADPALNGISDADSGRLDEAFAAAFKRHPKPQPAPAE